MLRRELMGVGAGRWRVGLRLSIGRRRIIGRLLRRLRVRGWRWAQCLESLLRVLWTRTGDGGGGWCIITLLLLK
jgi:hypothetical protein